MLTEKILYSGAYLSLHSRDDWEFATRRPKASGVVAVLAITDHDEIVLVEQYRRPVQAHVIEICAGLVGDEDEFKNESLEETARRELLEETGYEAGKITPLFSSPTSPGMTDEITHFFLATQLTKINEGGGLDGEDIEVHLVPKKDIFNFLSSQEKENRLIDFKIHAALLFFDRTIIDKP